MCFYLSTKWDPKIFVFALNKKVEPKYICFNICNKKKVDPNLFVFVFGPQNCIRPTLVCPETNSFTMANNNMILRVKKGTITYGNSREREREGQYGYNTPPTLCPVTSHLRWVTLSSLCSTSLLLRLLHSLHRVQFSAPELRKLYS